MGDFDLRKIQATMNLTRPTRKLGLSDAMLLIAASAFGLAVFQVINQKLLGGGVRWENLTTAPPKWTAGRVLVRVIEWVGPSLPFAASWTVAVPLLRLRSPRPPVRRLLRQPGTTACLAAILALVWTVLGWAGPLGVAAWLDGRPNWGSWLFQLVVVEVFPNIGLAVAAVWFGQAISVRWQPERDWLDGFGRILGAYWIIVGLVWTSRRYLEIMMF